MSREPSGEAAWQAPRARLESSRYRAVLELAALDKSDFAGVLRTILTTDARELDLERVNCWTLEDQRIRCVAGYLRATDRFESGAVIDAGSCPSYFRALADNPVILADDARTDSRTREFTDGYLTPLGITSMMDVPIWVRGRLWGVVCHEHVGPPRHWTEAERDFAISIGHIVAMAVEASERADLERVARHGEFFIGVLSHDLRHPLATILAAADLLSQNETDLKRRRATQQIVRNTDLMARMIDQLLDFTRIRVGAGMPMNRTLVDVAGLVGQVISDLAPALASQVDVEVHGDCTGLYDLDRVWQAVSNLLNNALQHGRPGGRARILVVGTDSDRVTITVGNAGEIAADVRTGLFEPFKRHRAPGPNAGLGLGLFIVREIVAAHDGTIAVASEAGQVTFTMTLPRHRPSA